MNDDNLRSPAEIKIFLAGTQTISLKLPKKERNAFIAQTLKRTHYLKLKRVEKSIVRQYLLRISNCSSPQLTRLICQYREKGQIGCTRTLRQKFSRRYTHDDLLMLVETDRYHETLSGPATKKLFERAYHVFGDERYLRLSSISPSHIYNLRKSDFYQRQRFHIDKTKRTQVAIGERRKPQPNGEPGYIRIDTVHQGNQDKQKGVYHINAVDEVTQFEVVCSVEKISERYLIPTLETILESFPFKIKGFHSDNGSEYVNYTVARLLNKLLIEFTKSRSRHSNDNALAESKNCSIVRKILGYGYRHYPCKKH